MTDSKIKRIQPMEPQRDGGGWWTHPDFFEPANGNEYPVPGEFDAWKKAHDVECTSSMMCDEYDNGSDLVRDYGEYCDCAAWDPDPPAGNGWFLVSIHDTEDGPCAVWLRHKPTSAEDERICTCIKCGCTDDHACVDDHGVACHWVKVDRSAGTGICSQCAPEWVEKLAEDK